MNLSLYLQKIICIGILFSANILLATTFIIYSDKWYAYIFILGFASLINSTSVILLFYDKIRKKISYDKFYRTIPRKYLYIIPTYNESQEELELGIKSLSNQRNIEGDIYSLCIICDGRVTGKGNNISTDNILKNILNNYDNPLIFKYITADYKTNIIEIYKGIYKNIPYLLIVKLTNYGKRDSLVIVRRLAYLYNENIVTHPLISEELIKYTRMYFEEIFTTKIDYIIGIDADTQYEYDCSYELIKQIEFENDDTIVGCVGIVDIDLSINKYSFGVLYQYAEYMFAQLLKRQTQSRITHKVNCLSGCNQILKICAETCGDKILSRFNKLPPYDANIFDHIRSYASEDRNHVCLIHSMYPHTKTIQAIKAIALTRVPTTIDVFISQRRRWSLGALSNDMLLIYLPGITFVERISACVNLITYSVNPFIFIATVTFLYSLITSPSYLMLLLSIVMIIPFGYALLIPIIIRPLLFHEILYYYLSLIIFLSCGSIINLCIYFYSLFNMDILTWGKTRLIDKVSLQKNIENDNDDNDVDIIDIDNISKIQFIEDTLDETCGENYEFV
jgi:chitin synthase